MQEIEPLRTRLIKRIYTEPLTSLEMSEKEWVELRMTAQPFEISFNQNGNHEFYGLPVRINHGP